MATTTVKGGGSKAYESSRYAGRSRFQQHKLVADYIAETDATTGWTGSGCTLSVDTTNVQSSKAATPASLKMTHTSGQSTFYAERTEASRDLTARLVYCRFFTAGAGDVNQLRIVFRSGGTWDNTFVVTLVSDGYVDADGFQTAWGSVAIGASAGAWDATDIDRMRVQGTMTDDNNTAVIVVDSLIFYDKPTRTPRVAITFDDQETTQYAAAQYLHALGIPATYFVIPSLVGVSRMTWAQLTTLQEHGDLIANHSWSHLGWVTGSLTQAERVAEYVKALESLIEHGFDEGARVFALPGGTGEWDSDADDDFLGSYTDLVRLTGAADGSTIGVPDGRKKVYIRATADSAALATTAVDRAIASGGDVCVLFHFGENIKTFFDYVATKRDAGDIDPVIITDLLTI